MTTAEEWDAEGEESVEDVREMLRRHHPELSDEAIDRILSGPPPKRRMTTRPDAGWVENRGRRQVMWSGGGGTGRTTGPLRSTMRETAGD